MCDINGTGEKIRKWGFDAFRDVVSDKHKAYLMENHGVIVAGKTIMDAFICLKILKNLQKSHEC